jgi:hypothetical protein
MNASEHRDRNHFAFGGEREPVGGRDLRELFGHHFGLLLAVEGNGERRHGLVALSPCLERRIEAGVDKQPLQILETLEGIHA